MRTNDPDEVLRGSQDSHPGDLESVYREYHDFVWRTLYHLGIRGDAVNDAVHEVFLVVHRRLCDYDGRTAIKNWLYGIVRRVASDHRKKVERRNRRLRLVPDHDQHSLDARALERLSAAELVDRFLEELDEDKRTVFILAEVEGMTAPEISAALGVNLNTIYARLRAVRLRFQRLVDERNELQEGRAWNG